MSTDYRYDPVGFIDRFIPRNEKGEPWQVNRHQRRVLTAGLRWDAAGRLLIRSFLWGEMKKSGKTFLAACLVLWWAFVTPNTEIIIAANDLEQSVGRVFQTVVKLLEHNPDLGHSAKVRSNDIELTNGTTITAIASDYKGAAGSRHSLVVFDELWGYSLEASQRLFEELTPPPTEANAWLLIVTYAGWSGESVLLERLYKQGLAGERVDDELECYQNEELFMFWSHTPRQPWQTERYYAEQRRSLRPNTFARLHENKWVSGESAFLTPELWDANVDQTLTPPLLTFADQVYVGIDIGIKSDHAAVEGVIRTQTGLVHVLHRLWKPSRTEPLDLQVVEDYLLDLHHRAHIRLAYYDPYQFHGSAGRLKAAGVRIQEFPQSNANCTRMGQTLFEVLTGRHLRLLPLDDLRAQALNTVAIENARGWRIAKEKASRKIDAVVALSIACVAALDQPVQAPWAFFTGGRHVSSRQEESLVSRLVSAVRGTVEAVSDRLVTVVTKTADAAQSVVEILTPPSPDELRRIESLSEGVRSPEEQAILDQHYARQTHTRQPNDFESEVIAKGLFWPSDSGYVRHVGPQYDLQTELQQVQAMFNEWRAR